jgi:hypothetical protein
LEELLVVNELILEDCEMDVRHQLKREAAVHLAGHVVAAFATGGYASARLHEEVAEGSKAFEHWFGNVKMSTPGATGVVCVAGAVADSLYGRFIPLFDGDESPADEVCGCVNDPIWDEQDAIEQHGPTAFQILQDYDSFHQWVVDQLFENDAVDTQAAAMAYGQAVADFAQAVSVRTTSR